MVKDEIKVPHPDYGYVLFSNTTHRQKEILNRYLKQNTYLKLDTVCKKLKKKR